MNNIKKLVLTFAALSAAFVGLSAQNNHAMAANEADYHLGITPTQSNLGALEPGKSYTGEFKVRNQGNKTAEFEVVFAPYSVKNENYDPVYDESSSYTEISKWITTDQDGGIIEPNAEQSIKFTVNVPADAHGGSQSAIIAIRLKQENNATDTAIQAVQQLGYLVYGNVDGEIIQTGKVLENKIPSFLFTSPITATSLVENTGNVYTAATYKLQVFPLFGDEEVYTNEEEPDKNIIFPETKRFYTASWEGAPQLGIFRVRQTVKIFDDESVVEKLVFICPIWFLFIVLLIIFVAIFWIVSRIRGRNKE